MRKRRARRYLICAAIAILSFLVCRADSVGAVRVGPAVFVIALSCGIGSVLALIGE